VSLHPVQIRHPRPTRYVAAASLTDAVEQLTNPEYQPARIIAGGTDLLLEIERGSRRGVGTLVDISRAADTANITIVDGVARLGPMVTHADVVNHAGLVAGALPLAQACWEVGSPQLRNRATVAGNIVTASPANDTLSALLALGASVELLSTRGRRTLTVDEFVTGFRTTALADDEIVASVDVPLLRSHERGIYVKVGNRSAQAISVVHAALVVGFAADGVTVTNARIALGSVAPTVVLVPDAAVGLVGCQLDADAIARAASVASASVTPIADVRATADYRADIIEVIVRRALHALAAGRERDRWPTNAPTLADRERAPRTFRAGIEITPGDLITTTVNGAVRTAPTSPGVTLLDWLRDELGATGTKEGCAEGECGACTVQLDGAAVMSCLVPAARGDGADIVTVEGLSGPDGDLHAVQEAFVACAAVQCGFCTPGFVVAAAQLLAECPTPTTEQIHQGLAGNLCRCTGYTSIVAAVERASGRNS
jgi:xanthine dehydrogenase iron-sulfur cluster and FAD-binding subunit A